MRLAVVSVAALTTALIAAAVAPSFAQAPMAVTSITIRPVVTPSKAGTKRKPQSVRVRASIDLRTAGPDGFDKPIVQKAVVDFPKGSLYLGGTYPSCTKAQLDQGLPQDVCPKAIVGTGTGDAWADTARTKPKFTLVNGGASKAFLYTQLVNPAVVNAPIPATVRRGGRFGGYRVTALVPDELQVVAGTPISLISARGRTTAKNWIATTSCPKDRKWPFEVTTSQDATADAVFTSFVRCRS
jgi:hypothetical protein